MMEGVLIIIEKVYNTSMCDWDYTCSGIFWGLRGKSTYIIEDMHWVAHVQYFINYIHKSKSH